MIRRTAFAAALMLLALPWCAAAQTAAATAQLTENLKPFVDCLTGREAEFALDAEVRIGPADKSQKVHARIVRRDDQSFSLSIEHTDYAVRIERDANTTRLILPKHERVYIGRGPLSTPHTLAPAGLATRLFTDATQATTYLMLLNTAGEQGAALLLNQQLAKHPDVKLTSAKQPAMVRLNSDKGTITLRRIPVSEASPGETPSSWKTESIDRDELEMVLMCGVRRLLEVTAPSAKLTHPAREPRQVEHGELRWVQDQRLVLLSGTPQQIGRAHGLLLREQANACMESVLYLFGTVNTIRTGRWFNNDLRDAYARLEKFIPDDHKAELDAMADAIGMDREMAQLGGVFPELFHCSGFALYGSATVGGKLYHGRVLDYMTMIGLQQSAATFVVAPKGKNAFVNVGYAGFIGCVTGMNQKQVSLGEMGGGGQGKWDGVPMSTLMRRALEECDTLAEVRELWANSPRTCEYYYVFADGKGPSAVGVAATPEHIEFIEAGQTHERLGDGIDDAVVLSAGNRLSCLRGRVIDQYGKIDAEAAMELMSRPVAMKSNLHNALFVPQDLKVYVTHADHERCAAERPYVMFDFGSLLQEMGR
ncbi:peptidase C45 acyl-coenzyme A:6-aminopenicillanic acid acyl-transferase [Planctomycetales bacterium ZRK34]|nr:peptidase C45 acyl-coenzyme A:6-aminopenicillanic acid acyl-transferase [Planctomycetales bacterium ZRK34]